MSITIRHSEAKDIEAIRQIYAQPSNYASTLQLPFPSREQWDARLARPLDSFYSIVACDGDQILGQIGVDVFTGARRKHVANIGLGVSESARRQGVGSALVDAAIDLCHNWLAVRRIELETYTDNKAAIGLFRKHGFVVEGTGVGYAFRDGRYVDVLFMAHHAEAQPGQ